MCNIHMHMLGMFKYVLRISFEKKTHLYRLYHYPTISHRVYVHAYIHVYGHMYVIKSIVDAGSSVIWIGRTSHFLSWLVAHSSLKLHWCAPKISIKSNYHPMKSHLLIVALSLIINQPTCFNHFPTFSA